MKYFRNEKLNSLGLINFITTKGRSFKLTENQEVIENINITLKENNISPLEIFSCHQVHSNNVEVIKSVSAGEKFVYGRYFKETDGLITDLPNLLLLTKFADCTPILLFDKKNRVQGNIHSGWRGTSLKISKSAIEKMNSVYGTNPKDIVAYIGPTIGKLDFEVEEDVVKIYRESFDFHKKIITQKNSTKYNIDLELTNILSLLELGVLQENIYSQGISTFSTDYLYSYRRDKEAYSLMAMMSMIVER